MIASFVRICYIADSHYRMKFDDPDGRSSSIYQSKTGYIMRIIGAINHAAGATWCNF